MIETAVVTQSFRATAAATPLRPLAAVTAGLIVMAGVVSWQSPDAPELIVAAAPAALAAGVALGLDDEGFRFIRTVPTTALARLGLRLAILVPAMVASAACLLVAGRLFFDGLGDPPSPSALAALVGTAIAVEVWWSRHRPDYAAEGAAAVVVAWALSPSVLPAIRVLQDGAYAWHTHALVVLSISVVAAIVGSRGREA